MTKWLGVAILAPILMLGAAATVQPVAAVSAELERHPATALDKRTYRPHWHRHRYVDRPEEQPRYYGRPVYYTPAPFVPLPPLFDYGREP
jgi:hypothetical protein